MTKAKDQAAAQAAEAEAQAQADAAAAAEAEQDNPDTLVYIKHQHGESVGGPVPRHALRDYWASKGWAECDPPEEDA